MNYIITFYGLFLAGYIIYSFFGLYHLKRFGYSGDLSKIIAKIYVILSVLIVASSLFYFFYYLLSGEK